MKCFCARPGALCVKRATMPLKHTVDRTTLWIVTEKEGTAMKLVRDTWLLFSWSVAATLRNPTWAIIGLFQPLCYLLLFGPLLQSLSNVPGFPPGGAQTVFTPGVMIMMGIFSTAFVGFGLISEIRSGFIERLRITPLSRLALALGRILCDVVLLLVQALLLFLLASPLCLRPNLVGLLLVLGLLVLLGVCMA